MDKQSVRLIISKALEAKLVVKIVHEYLLDRDFTSFSPRKIRAMQNKGTFLLRVVWIQVPEFSWQWSLQCTFNSGSKGTLVGAGPLSFRCVCVSSSVWNQICQSGNQGASESFFVVATAETTARVALEILSRRMKIFCWWLFYKESRFQEFNCRHNKFPVPSPIFVIEC